MKHSLLLLTLALGLMSAAQAQEANGHFSMRYAGGVTVTDLEGFCRTQLPDLCEGSTFETTRDVTDRQGVRHVTMQQYVNGVRSSGKTMNIHVRDGRILSINGNVLTQTMASPAIGAAQCQASRPAAEVLRQAGLPETLAEHAELVVVEHEGVARRAYRVLCGMERMLIDAETGEVLARKSIIQHWGVPEGEKVSGKGKTFYQGEQEIDLAKLADGSYTLLDYGRKIYTLDASYEALVSNGFDWSKQQRMSALNGMYWPTVVPDPDDEEHVIRQFEEFESACNLYRNDSPDWVSPANSPCIDSLTYYLDAPEQSEVNGELVFAEIFLDSEGNRVRTDTVRVEGKQTTLHLPQTVTFGDRHKVLVFLLVYSPETNEDKTLGYEVVGECSNMQTIYMSDYPDPQTEEEYQQLMQDILDYGYLNVHISTKCTTPMLDVQWGVARVYDYYRDVYGLNSFDNEGTEIYCFVNTPEVIFPALNAAALELETKGAPGIMLYGLGQWIDEAGFFINPFVALQVIGHEYTHLVARGLATDKEDQEGCYAKALNESFADIMCLAIEREVTWFDTWNICEALMPGGIGVRAFDIPEVYGHPSSYLDENFDTKTYEEHRNAGVQNHMFYLLVTGDEGVNSLGQHYAVTPMDRDEAEALAFSTLYNHTFAEMNYEDAAKAWVDAAIEMFGEESEQVKSVRQAWAAVGLGNDDVTGIEQLSNDNKQHGSRYTLFGTEAGKGYRGIVVREGKKVVL